jgi:hypothetical protein
MATQYVAVAACMVIIALLLIWVCRSAREPPREGFYTTFAQEEPTRDYVAFTGSENRGWWGARPWAEVFSSP